MTEVHTHQAQVGVTSLISETTDSFEGSRADSTATVTMRYFAAARAATAVDEETLTLRTPASVESALAAAVEAHGDELQQLLPRCSYLRNSVAVHGLSTPLNDGDALDVLPPFAGG